MKKSLAEWYIKNKSKIWTVIVCIIVIVLINRLLVFIAKKNNDKQSNIIYNNSQTEQKPVYNSVSLESTQSATLGEDMNEYQTELLGTIDQFITYCNEQKVEDAYNLLSDDCKNELYPSVNDFKNSYYNKVFNGKRKNVSIENWSGNIYKVDINDDALSTGQFTEANNIQDYITIVTDNEGNAKLNINGYIEREDINRSGSNKDVEITAIESDNYMEYQIITFSVKNNTDNQILIGDINNNETMYLEDENGMKYLAYTHEISEPELMINAKQTKQVKIKFYSSYVTTKNIKQITFSRIVFNYNKNEARDYAGIIINL